jgi:hypothetical protein
VSPSYHGARLRLVDVDDEIECPGCGDLIDVRRPLGVELSVLHDPTNTSVAGPARIIVGGDVVHECDPVDAGDERVARWVGDVLRDERAAR